MTATTLTPPPTAGTQTTINNSGRVDLPRPVRIAPPVSRPKPTFDWELFWTRVKYWLWTIISKTLVTVVYLPIASQGLRYVLPDIGLRLYKLPGLAFLQDFTATYRLDLAHLFTAVPLALSWIFWQLNLELYIWPDTFADRFRRATHLHRVKNVIASMGAVIITGDAILFCAAFTLAQWGAARFSVAAVIATLVYVTALGAVTFVSICLSESIEYLKTKE